MGIALQATAQNEESGGGSSLGDLLNKVKDIKVPDSVSSLPTQITELKESYLETAATVDALRIEVDQLKQRVYELSKQNAALQEAVGVKVKENQLTEMLKPIEISATDLVKAFKEDRAAAEAAYRDRYLKVVGVIAKFESGSQSPEMFLRADGFDSLVRCAVPVSADLYIDVLPNQGQLISRNDRRALLTVGQPVAVFGTCTGAGLNVDLMHGRIDGLVEKKIETSGGDKK